MSHPRRKPHGPRRPVLRYHGSKWRVAPWIIAHFPPHRVYIEPFGGGASVLLRKPRSVVEVYNEIDREVSNVFAMLRDPVAADRLSRDLALTPYSRAEFELSHEPCGDLVELARRTIVRSFMGQGSAAIFHASGFRRRLSNDRGGAQYISPSAEWENYVLALPAFRERLAGVLFETTDGVELLDDAQYSNPNVLVYADPPYLPATRSARMAHDKGYRFELRLAGHERLRDRLLTSEAMVVLSGYPSSVYDEWYAGWRRVETQTRALGNLERTEVLWINVAADAALRAPELDFA